MSLGGTHYNWRPDVRQVVDAVLMRWPGVTANTYADHPWPGWDGRSIDFWGPGGRGSPIAKGDGRQIRRFLRQREIGPNIRHTIFRHTLWTSWGGRSPWPSNDHSGELRHLHVTYW